MTIKLKVHPSFIAGADAPAVITVRGASVGECLKDAENMLPGLRPERFMDGAKLKGDVLAYVNGEDTYPEETAAAVGDGDFIALIPIIGGG